jgi:hypothetical protein
MLISVHWRIDMKKEEFLNLLEFARQHLEQEAKTKGFSSPSTFEKRVREIVADIIEEQGYDSLVDFHSHVQAFPDICLGSYGIEVKFTEKDTWKGVANSINQGMKDNTVEEIYVMWCKQGGEPYVAVRPYEDVVYHVRTSHVPRFEIDMQTNDSLFKKFRLDYKEFSVLGVEQKMDFVRSYARSRLKAGVKQFYWYLESQVVDEGERTKIQLFDKLPALDQKKLVHEEFLLVPKLITGSCKELMFDDRVRHFLNKHQVLYPHRFTLYRFSDDHQHETIELDRELIRELSISIDINSIRRFWRWSDSPVLKNKDLWGIWVEQVNKIFSKDKQKQS